MKKYLNARDLLLFAEAWVLLAVARLMLLFVPFRKIVPVLQYKKVNNMPEDEKARLLAAIQIGIARASVRSPWRTKCFEQALAAKMMTRRRGIASVTYFGVRKTQQQKINAHAWLKCGDFIVTGWQRVGSYKVVAEF